MSHHPRARRISRSRALPVNPTAAVVGALLAAFVLSGCGAAESGETDATGARAGITRLEPADRTPAPDISGTDLDGEPLSLESFAGRVVVVNIWGSWCPPCRQEQPVLSKLATELKPQGVEFIGIAVREGAATSKAYTEDNNVPYPSISDSGGRLLVGFTSSLPAVAVPTTYVVDREGRVATRMLDVATEATLRALITDVLREP